MQTSSLVNLITALKPKSAWKCGVQGYAISIIARATDGQETDIPTENQAELEKYLLNGAQTWQEASNGGCFEIYDQDIAKRLCNATEYKMTNGGQENPNKCETWLDTQGRALWQASCLIHDTIQENKMRDKVET